MFPNFLTNVKSIEPLKTSMPYLHLCFYSHFTEKNQAQSGKWPAQDNSLGDLFQVLLNKEASKYCIHI